MKKEFPKNNINMKKIILATTFVFALAGFSFAQNSHGTSEKQELNSKGQPVVKIKDNAPVDLKAGESITRGEALVASVKKVSVEKVLAAPDKFADKTVAVEGVIVRSCKKEGCWPAGRRLGNSMTCGPTA